MKGTLVIPVPHTDNPADGSSDFNISGCTQITVNDPSILSIGHRLGRLLAQTPDAALPVDFAAALPAGGILLELAHQSDGTGSEDGSYELRIGTAGIRVASESAAGVFYGVQTLVQLLANAEDGLLPSRTIIDAPRFAYRGFMLDVVRHFFPVETVKRVIDRMAAFKLNALHLHLSDDQGWRIAISSRPKLVELGSTNEVGGGPGGHYSRADWQEILDYAAEHFVTVIPEIDLPGHTNAALVAYPELAPAGVTPAPYTDIAVGFSTLDIANPASFEFVRDVITELSEMTPGPYLHIGGDESLSTSIADYRSFMKQAVGLVQGLGKIPIGWHELGQCGDLVAGSIGQYWGYSGQDSERAEQLRSFVAQGDRVILSPCDRIYLDIRESEESTAGTLWNGEQVPTTLFRAYDWDPATLVAGVGESDIVGIEAALWTEHVSSLEQIDELLFPRLAAAAEIAWSPAPGETAPLRNWQSFSERVAEYFAAPHVDLD